MMNRRKLLPSLIAGAAATQSTLGAAEWQNPFAREWRDSFLLHWKVTRDYTLAVADAMPADGYESKPVAAQRSFGEQLIHLGLANSAYVRAFGVKDPPAAPKMTDKETARTYLTATFDYVTEVLQKIDEKALLRKDLNFSSRQKPHSGTDLFMRAYMHTAHHRGQLVVYLRVKGIVPPTWAFEPTA
jgi:uncharacterized damage-inducible protein DinB